MKLEALIQLETRYASAKAWIDRAAKLLLKKNITNSLLEVSLLVGYLVNKGPCMYCTKHTNDAGSFLPNHFRAVCNPAYNNALALTHLPATLHVHSTQSILPRTKVSFPHRHTSKSVKKKSESDSTPPGNMLADLAGDEAMELEKIRSMEKEEVEYMRELRAENSQKVQRDEELKGSRAATSPVLYCFCRRPESGYMLQCELCNEWYHASCLHLTKGKQCSVEKDSRFVCTLCVRTRRPRLDGLVSLLISLKKVPVIVTEGLALQCLVERAIAWQKRAKQFIVAGSAGLETVRQQLRRMEELKVNIRRWRAEAECSRDWKSSTSIQVQLASSAGTRTCGGW